jgi:hypothetical protein
MELRKLSPNLNDETFWEINTRMIDAINNWK